MALKPGKVWRFSIEGGDGDGDKKPDVDVDLEMQLPIIGAQRFHLDNIPVPIQAIASGAASLVSAGIGFVPGPAQRLVRAALGAFRGFLGV